MTVDHQVPHRVPVIKEEVHKNLGRLVPSDYRLIKCQFGQFINSFNKVKVL